MFLFASACLELHDGAEFEGVRGDAVAANERFFRNWGLIRPLGLFDDKEE